MKDHLAIGQTAFQGFRRWHKTIKRFRIAGYCVGLALMVLLSALLQVIGPIKNEKLYVLSPEMRALAGESRDDVRQYLKLDDKTGNYTFEVPKDTEANKEQTGRKADAYTANFATDPRQGMSFTDTTTDITIKMVPKFYTGQGKKVDGDHIVYPFGPNKLTYTLKYNGVKEDIILPAFQGDKLTYDFELILPAGVEARLDKQGNIGIYSADTTFYGNITYGSDSDRELVDKARENSEKTHLLATIPYPIVKDAQGQEYTDIASFQLGNPTTRQIKTELNKEVPAEVQAQMQSKMTQHVYVLKLAAKGLRNLAYPISIDPTMQSTSASDFGLINNEGGAEVDGSGLIKRTNLSGGSVGSWSYNAANNLPQTRQATRAIIYNGYVYVTGDDPDDTTSAATNIIYAKLDATGNVLGNWSSEIDLPNVISNIVIYNGYMYAFGGYGGANNPPSNLTYYAKLNPNNGSIGTWKTTNGYITGRIGMGAVAHNGYMYIAGGLTRTPDALFVAPDTFTYHNDVQYAPIRADGTLGVWATTTSFTVAARLNAPLTAYNNKLYFIGGCNDEGSREFNCYTNLADGQYASLNNDGTVGTWSNLNSLPAGNKLTRGHDMFIYKGYMVAMTGSGVGENALERLVYAPVYPTGAIGNWQIQTISLNITRSYEATTVYNDRLLVVGGKDVAGGVPSLAIESASVNPAGSITPFVDSGSNFTTARWGHATAVYNGYIYIAGGCSVSNCHTSHATTTYLATVYYAQISSSGTLGTWTAAASLPSRLGFAAGRLGATMVAHNGWLYVVGGSIRDTGDNNNTYETDYLRTQLASNGAFTGSCSSWCRTSGALNEGRHFHTTAIHNNTVYVINGSSQFDFNSAVNSTEYATINADGTLGTFNTTNTPGTQRAGHATVVTSGYIYVIGGYVNGMYYDTIEQAKINSDGTLDTWTSSGNDTLSTASVHLSAYVHKGKLYVAGGYSNAGMLSTVEVADVGSSGVIGQFSTVGINNLGTGRFGHRSVVYGNFIYAVGGCTAAVSISQVSGCTAWTATTEFSQVNNGGSGGVDSWTTWNPSSTNSLVARDDMCVVAINGFMYAIGGNDGTNTVSTVKYAAVAANGSVGNWATTSALPGTRHRAGCAVHNGYIYVLGGQDNAGNAVSTIYYAKPISNGTIPSNGAGSWITSAQSMSTSIQQLSSVAHNNYLYVIGGRNGSNGRTTLEYAQLDSSSGALVVDNPSCAGSATWCAASSTFATARLGQATAIYNNYIYILGGCATLNGSGSCTNYLSDVQYGAVESSGDVSATCGSSWCYAPSLPQNSWYIKNAIAVNGFMYYVGGILDSPTTTSLVRYAPILSNGNLGSWSNATNLPTGVAGAGTLGYNGRLYVVGGRTGGTTQSTTYYGSMNSISRVASFSKLYDFDKGVRPTKLVTRGTKKTNSITMVSYKGTVNTNTTITNLNTTSDVLTSPTHGWPEWQRITFQTTGTMPGGMAANTPYYIRGPSVNAFTISTTIGGGALDITSAGTGTLTYKVFENPTFDTALTSSDSGYGGVNAISITQGSNVTQSRYFWVRYTLDDTYSAVFPDAGNENNIEAFDVYYVSNPGTRLRGGRSFTNGIDRGITANP